MLGKGQNNFNKPIAHEKWNFKMHDIAHNENGATLKKKFRVYHLTYNHYCT